MVGLLIRSLANVTVQNFGINDVENLTLLISNESAENFAQRISIDVICAGEIQTVSIYYYWTLGLSGKTTITLKQGQEILDEYN